MAYEIEHKYLVKDDTFKNIASEVIEIKQGYLCKEPARIVRVRTWNNRGFITVKGITIGDKRHEYEYEIPYNDAVEMLEMCNGELLVKKRYIIEFEGFKWEVDEFEGKRKGLIIAEIELPEEGTEYTLPTFVGENVTGNPNYFNSNLC